MVTTKLSIFLFSFSSDPCIYVSYSTHHLQDFERWKSYSRPHTDRSICYDKRRMNPARSSFACIQRIRWPWIQIHGLNSRPRKALLVVAAAWSQLKSMHISQETVRLKQRIISLCLLPIAPRSRPSSPRGRWPSDSMVDRLRGYSVALQYTPIQLSW